MSDRELLELAAKAAGYEAQGMEQGLMYLRGVQEGWNPLINDGDALRLAVKLEMQLRLRHSEYQIEVYGGPYGRTDESGFSDPYAATRRAIVRAAADVGRELP